MPRWRRCQNPVAFALFRGLCSWVARSLAQVWFTLTPVVWCTYGCGVEGAVTYVMAHACSVPDPDVVIPLLLHVLMQQRCSSDLPIKFDYTWGIPLGTLSLKRTVV